MLRPLQNVVALSYDGEKESLSCVDISTEKPTHKTRDKRNQRRSCRVSARKENHRDGIKENKGDKRTYLVAALDAHGSLRDPSRAETPGSAVASHHAVQRSM